MRGFGGGSGGGWRRRGDCDLCYVCFVVLRGREMGTTQQTLGWLAGKRGQLV